jgi:flagellar biosynthesis/type III secretory pathway protein FliH
MSRKGFISAEELRGTHLEAFPYFPVDTSMSVNGLDEGRGSVASDLGDTDASLIPIEERIIDRLQEAERQAQEIARQAYEEGFAAGEAEGRSFGESQYKAYIQRLETHLTELAEVTVSLQRALNDQMVALTLAVGEHLAVQQIKQMPEAVQALLEGVLEELPFPLPRGRREGEMPMQVFLSSPDLEQLGDQFQNHAGLTLSADPALSRGSLRFEAPQGILNGTMEQRREQIMQVIARMQEGETP